MVDRTVPRYKEIGGTSNGRSRKALMAEDTDSNQLLNAVLPLAQQMLGKRGTFLPFGASVSSSGEVALCQGMPDTDSEQAVLDMLVSALRQQASDGMIRGSALCYDSRVTMPGGGEKHEAICVELEHASERCARLFLPYRKGFLKRISYGQLFGSTQEPRVFEGRNAG
jgi:hypothetical protein